MNSSHTTDDVPQENILLGWSVVSLITALVAAILAFSGLANPALQSVVWGVFFGGLVLGITFMFLGAKPPK